MAEFNLEKMAEALAEKAIADLASRDIVEVVRCNNCKHWQYDKMFNEGWCDGRWREWDDYCSRAERKEE